MAFLNHVLVSRWSGKMVIRSKFIALFSMLVNLHISIAFVETIVPSKIFFQPRNIQLEQIVHKFNALMVLDTKIEATPQVPPTICDMDDIIVDNFLKQLSARVNIPILEPYILPYSDCTNMDAVRTTIFLLIVSFEKILQQTVSTVEYYDSVAVFNKILLDLQSIQDKVIDTGTVEEKEIISRLRKDLQSQEHLIKRFLRQVEDYHIINLIVMNLGTGLVDRAAEIFNEQVNDENHCSTIVIAVYNGTMDSFDKIIKFIRELKDIMACLWGLNTLLREVINRDETYSFNMMYIVKEADRRKDSIFNNILSKALEFGVSSVVQYENDNENDMFDIIPLFVNYVYNQNADNMQNLIELVVQFRSLKNLEYALDESLAALIENNDEHTSASIFLANGVTMLRDKMNHETFNNYVQKLPTHIKGIVSHRARIQNLDSNEYLNVVHFLVPQTKPHTSNYFSQKHDICFWTFKFLDNGMNVNILNAVNLKRKWLHFYESEVAANGFPNTTYRTFLAEDPPLGYELQIIDPKRSTFVIKFKDFDGYLVPGHEKFINLEKLDKMNLPLRAVWVIKSC